MTTPSETKMAEQKEMHTAFSDLRSANIARQKEWDAGNQLSLAYRGNELAGEVGEACNVIKKLERERLGIRGSRDTLEHLAEELADVVICVDLIAMHEGIDLDKAVADKFNATSEKVGLSTRLAYPSLLKENEELRDLLIQVRGELSYGGIPERVHRTMLEKINIALKGKL